MLIEDAKLLKELRALSDELPVLLGGHGERTTAFLNAIDGNQCLLWLFWVAHQHRFDVWFDTHENQSRMIRIGTRELVGDPSHLAECHFLVRNGTWNASWAASLRVDDQRPRRGRNGREDGWCLVETLDPKFCKDLVTAIDGAAQNDGKHHLPPQFPRVEGREGYWPRCYKPTNGG